MATITGATSQWIYSPEHGSYYRVEWRVDGQYRYIWQESYTLPQCLFHCVSHPFYPPYNALHNPCHYNKDPHLSSSPDSASHTGTLQKLLTGHHRLNAGKVIVYTGRSEPYNPHSTEQCYTSYTNPQATRAYISVPPRTHRAPSQSYRSGYCDYCGCQNPYCIELQLTTQGGFRDDLRHHEDQDKNGNMKDGDNVGVHSPSRTRSYLSYTEDDGASEDRDSDDEG